jgi:hypothetical protein
MWYTQQAILLRRDYLKAVAKLFPRPSTDLAELDSRMDAENSIWRQYVRDMDRLAELLPAERPRVVPRQPGRKTGSPD